jgi:mRNA interferase MazF
MTGVKHGDVVLVNFFFTDESGVKHRPAVIVSTDRYHRGRQEAVVAAITSNVTRLLAGDYKLRAWREAGLLYPSVVTGIIRTVKHAMISRRLGTVAAADLQAVKGKLREVLAL